LKIIKGANRMNSGLRDIIIIAVIGFIFYLGSKDDKQGVVPVHANDNDEYIRWVEKEMENDVILIDDTILEITNNSINPIFKVKADGSVYYKNEKLDSDQIIELFKKLEEKCCKHDCKKYIENEK
jgi:hypothetical protein